MLKMRAEGAVSFLGNLCSPAWVSGGALGGSSFGWPVSAARAGIYARPNRVYCLVFNDLAKGFGDLGINFMKTLETP